MQTKINNDSFFVSVSVTDSSELGKIFFISDLHFWHRNIQKYCHETRPVEEMEKSMIKDWNRSVPSDGIVFMLGDFSFANLEKTESILDQLNGEIYWIWGNHDKNLMSDLLNNSTNSKINLLGWYGELKICIGGTNPKYHIILSHFGMRSWHQQHRGSWHLYGHSHGNLKSYGKSVDVGVDSIELKSFLAKNTSRTDLRVSSPYSFFDIESFMQTKEIVSANMKTN